MARRSGFQTLFGLALVAVVLGWSADVSAQAARAKRQLKAQKLFYVEQGLIDVEPQVMQKMLFLTGTVPTEEHKARAEELGKKVRGITEVRNRITVREPEAATLSGEALCAKIEGKIEDSEDLAKARRKFEMSCEGAGVKLTGKLGDWSDAQQLIRFVRDVPGVQTLDFTKLKY